MTTATRTKTGQTYTAVMADGIWYGDAVWTPKQMIDGMKAAGWTPCPTPAVWMHGGGQTVNLHERMEDGRFYWRHLAERHATPDVDLLRGTNEY